MTQDKTNEIPWLVAFERWLENKDRSAHSIRAYLSDVRQFSVWFPQHTGEAFTLEAVTESDVRAWRDHLDANLKPASVNRKLAALASLYRWARDTGKTTRDPTVHINGVQQQPIAPKALSDLDLKRILRAAEKSGKSRDWALLELLAATGLRAAEIAGLTTGDLDFGERHGWVTVRGKGRKQRRVPVNVKARHAVNAYLDERGACQPADPLFLTQRGAALTPYAVWYTVKKYAKLAGVTGITPHTFRHTVATRLVRDPDTDIVTAAAFLGHARLDTTARYSQPDDRALESAAEKLGGT